MGIFNKLKNIFSSSSKSEKEELEIYDKGL